MMKRTNNKSPSKSNKPHMKYTKLQEVNGAAQIGTGEMWLKSGKYDPPSVSIKIDSDETISDWIRKITLRNVVLAVECNDRGYPELVISGQENDEDVPF